METLRRDACDLTTAQQVHQVARETESTEVCLFGSHELFRRILGAAEGSKRCRTPTTRPDANSSDIR